MICTKCGKGNTGDAHFCIYCGEKLQNAVPGVTPPPRVNCNDFGLDLVLPPNPYALWAYYLGLASVICGIFTGIPALTCGIMAMEYDKEHPNRSARFHAWFGIVFGVLSILFLLFLISFFILA